MPDECIVGKCCVMKGRIAALEEKDRELAAELKKNTELTQEIRNTTAEIVEIHRNAKLGVHAIAFVIRSFKWAGGLALIPLSIWYYWTNIR